MTKALIKETSESSSHVCPFLTLQELWSWVRRLQTSLTQRLEPSPIKTCRTPIPSSRSPPGQYRVFGLKGAMCHCTISTFVRHIMYSIVCPGSVVAIETIQNSHIKNKHVFSNVYSGTVWFVISCTKDIFIYEPTLDVTYQSKWNAPHLFTCCPAVESHANVYPCVASFDITYYLDHNLWFLAQSRSLGLW